MVERKRFGNTEDDLADGITYDNLGRMRYHPEFHPNHKKPFTIDEMIYVSKFHGIDSPRTLSFALGRTEYTIANLITVLRKSGLYETYRNMPYEKWEALVGCQKDLS